MVTKDQLLAVAPMLTTERQPPEIGALLGKDGNGASAGTFTPDDANNPTKWTFAPVATSMERSTLRITLLMLNKEPQQRVNSLYCCQRYSNVDRHEDRL